MFALIAVAMVLNALPRLLSVVYTAPSSMVAICLRNEVSASENPMAATSILSRRHSAASSTALSLLPQMPSVRTTIILAPLALSRTDLAAASGLASVPLPSSLTLSSPTASLMTAGSMVRSRKILTLSPKPTRENLVNPSVRLSTKSLMAALTLSRDLVMDLERSTQTTMFLAIGATVLCLSGESPIQDTSSSIGSCSTFSCSPSWSAVTWTIPFSSYSYEMLMTCPPPSL